MPLNIDPSPGVIYRSLRVDRSRHYGTVSYVDYSEVRSCNLRVAKTVHERLLAVTVPSSVLVLASVPHDLIHHLRDCDWVR
jgi:hypothetical protein